MVLMFFLFFIYFVSVKTPWSNNESSAVFSFFKSNINKVPGKDECENCITKSNGMLKNRSWRDVKYYVYNYIKKVKKLKNA